MPRRKRRRNADVQLHIRLYPGQDDDLIDWAEELDEQPFGLKGQAVKEALRRGTRTDSGPTAAATPALDLAQVRLVVEAAVETALARYALVLPGQGGGGADGATGAGTGEDEELDALLDAMSATLVVSD